MYDSGREIARAYIIARKLLDKLTLGPRGGPKPCISIEELQDVIAEETGCKIQKFEVPFVATHLRERIERYKDGRVEIHVRQDQELYWKRFVTAKALLHLKIDREEDFNPYGDQMLEELIRRGHFGQASIPELAGEAAHSEVLAEMAALEVLYPLQRRREDIAIEPRPSILRLAHEYGIPPAYAATAMDPFYVEQLLKSLQMIEEADGGAPLD